MTPPAVRVAEPALFNQLTTAAQELGAAHDLGRVPKQRLPLPRVLAIANQKGGVGKTTTAVNLGASLAELGYRVLVIDLDPQGNATTGLGVNARNLDSSVYDVILHDLPIEDCIEPTNLRNLFLVPATIDLAGAEIELVPVFSRELRLKRAIATVLDDFDFVLIDCPPSLGLLTVNALAAAHEVAVPIQCEYYALEGLGQLLSNIAAPFHITISTLRLAKCRPNTSGTVMPRGACRWPHQGRREIGERIGQQQISDVPIGTRHALGIDAGGESQDGPML